VNACLAQATSSVIECRSLERGCCKVYTVRAPLYASHTVVLNKAKWKQQPSLRLNAFCDSTGLRNGGKLANYSQTCVIIRTRSSRWRHWRVLTRVNAFICLTGHMMLASSYPCTRCKADVITQHLSTQCYAQGHQYGILCG
jgi:hypothetical protein